MPSSNVIVFGGYGTFGAHIVRDLVAAGIHVTIAGRSRQRADRLARSFGPAHRGLAADVSNLVDCRAAIAGHQVAVNAAGPFSDLPLAMLDACLDLGCHYVDIADDRTYVARIRARCAEVEAAGLTAAYGCSSLPGISGAVAEVLREDPTTRIDHARITLFIGNRNPKGLAAVRSAAATIGRPIQTPQGAVMGFGDSERVPLYPPFGCRRTLNFSSPDYDLLPERIAVRSVIVKVGFELPGVNAAFGFAARCCPRLGRQFIPGLVPLSGLLGWLGSSGGQVMVELFAQGECIRKGAIIAMADGQRLAALPAVYVARQLCAQGSTKPGTVTAYEAIGARPLIDQLVADGYRFETG